MTDKRRLDKGKQKRCAGEREILVSREIKKRERERRLIALACCKFVQTTKY